MLRTPLVLLFCVIVCSSVVECPLRAASAEGVLTTAKAVRALTVEEAREERRVRLKGVYMGEADPEGIAFVVQDETEGIYVQGPPEQVAGLARGDLLEIEGVSDPGGFAPYVVARTVRKVGTAPIPEPLRVSLDDLNSGQLDARWVEISGIIRSIEPTEPTDAAPPPPGTRYAAPSQRGTRAEGTKVKVRLASGSARAVIGLSASVNAEEYLDAEVRVRGLCFNLHNKNRQFVRPFVQVPRGVDVVVERRPEERPFEGEPRPVSSLLRFDQLSGTPGHRVHIRGVVLHHRVGYTLWLRDRDQSIRVETTQTEVLQPGDIVDVVGFPARSDYSAMLEGATFRRLTSEAPPIAHEPVDPAGAMLRDADLIQFEAKLLDVRRFPDSVSLTLEWKKTTVRAQLAITENMPTPAGWLEGSDVRVAGVCAVKTDESGPLGGLWEPRSFHILLRTPADLTLLRPPPWWSAERVVWVLSGFLALALGAVALVTMGTRRRLKDQEHRRAMAEAEFAAILNERNRVAREIHDTLSQSLGAISVQLELARTQAGAEGATQRHIASAHQLARLALADARDSIWNMRSQVLEKRDLGGALDEILRQMTEGTPIEGRMIVEGEPRRLAPVVENNLLRIGQEAITNATRHARPSKIEVNLAFEGRIVRLQVLDDGVGFAVESAPPSERKSFGLMGIRERIEQLGGRVSIHSVPGSGTRVEVEVSV